MMSPDAGTMTVTIKRIIPTVGTRRTLQPRRRTCMIHPSGLPLPLLLLGQPLIKSPSARARASNESGEVNRYRREALP